MNIKTRLTLLLLAIALIGSFSEAHLTAAQAGAVNGDAVSERIKPPYSPASNEAGAVQDGRTARPGDIATGLVLDTSGAELRLNVRPCEAQPFVVIFHQPYNRSTRGQKNCAGQNATIEQIQQN